MASTSVLAKHAAPASWLGWQYWRKRLALLAVVTCVLACAAPKPPAQGPSPRTGQSLTLHADHDIPDLVQVMLKQAAQQWADYAGPGAIPIQIVFDLDPTSVSDVSAQIAAKHSFLRFVESDEPVVQNLDAELAPQNVRPLAFTATSTSGPRYVFFVVDRIPMEYFYHIALHEFGHVLGLPDLPTTTDVMSGTTDLKAAPVMSFTANDKALCQKAKYCP
jgi:hypothetical protein